MDLVLAHKQKATFYETKTKDSSTQSSFVCVCVCVSWFHHNGVYIEVGSQYNLIYVPSTTTYCVLTRVCLLACLLVQSFFFTRKLSFLEGPHGGEKDMGIMTIFLHTIFGILAKKGKLQVFHFCTSTSLLNYYYLLLEFGWADSC